MCQTHACLRLLWVYPWSSWKCAGHVWPLQQNKCIFQHWARKRLQMQSPCVFVCAPNFKGVSLTWALNTTFYTILFYDFKHSIFCLIVSPFVCDWTPNMCVLMVRCVPGWCGTTRGSSQGAGVRHALWLHLCPNIASASHLRQTAHGGDGSACCRERRGDPTCCRIQKFTSTWKVKLCF